MTSPGRHRGWPRRACPVTVPHRSARRWNTEYRRYLQKSEHLAQVRDHRAPALIGVAFAAERVAREWRALARAHLPQWAHVAVTSAADAFEARARRYDDQLPLAETEVPRNGDQE